MKKEEEMKNEVKGIVAFNFMVEVIQVPDHQKEFIVRVPTPNGGTGIACCGTIKEFQQFISSL